MVFTIRYINKCIHNRKVKVFLNCQYINKIDYFILLFLLTGITRKDYKIESRLYIKVIQFNFCMLYYGTDMWRKVTICGDMWRFFFINTKRHVAQKLQMNVFRSNLFILYEITEI